MKTMMSLVVLILDDLADDDNDDECDDILSDGSCEVKVCENQNDWVGKALS